MKEQSFTDAYIKGSMRSLDLGNLDGLDKQRAEKLKEALKLTANGGTTADLGAALRMLLGSDQELFDEVSAEWEDKTENKTLRYAYDRMAKEDGNGKNAFARAVAIDADAGDGNNDLATLYVEKAIKKRVEKKSRLMEFLDVKRMKAKQDKLPKSNNSAKCAFAAVSADMTDLTNTVDTGLGNTLLEAEKFGGTMFLEAEAFVKLDAEHIVQILEELSIAYHRGQIDQVINGNGTPPNATGLALNATAVTFDTNVTTTVVKMIAAVADASKGNSEGIFILTNTAAAIKFYAEKFIDVQYQNMIERFGLDFFQRIPVIEENVILTTGTSPNKAAPLYVGKKSDYALGIQRDPKIEMDKYSDFKAGGETARIMGFWAGKPHFNDSFAKTTVPTIY
jgi:hypothetical protein